MVNIIVILFLLHLNYPTFNTFYFNLTKSTMKKSILFFLFAAVAKNARVYSKKHVSLLKSVFMLCTATLLFSCTANDEPISEETSFLNQIKTSFNPNTFTDFGGGENWDIDWNNYTELTKDSTQIYTFALKAKNETKIQSDLFQEKVVHQIIGFKKGQKAQAYLLEVKSNNQSSLYTNDITHLENFNGIASVYTFSKELLGTITFNSGKANNYSRNKELDDLTSIFNLYYVPKLNSKIPSCSMTYFIYDLRYVDRYEVWSVGGYVILTKYLGEQLISSTKTATTVTYPCDSPSNTDDKYVVYRTNSYIHNEMRIVIAGPANVITNLKDYLKCFNLALGATFTIYVDQPIANSSDSWTLTSDNTPDPGHTFIAIQQGDIRRVFGYYPRNNVNPVTSPSDPSAFGNDQGHKFDVAVSIPINASQLQTIINSSVNSSTSTYNLNSFNCTDFAIKIGNLAGLNLPNSYGTWPGGGGSNPGQLGQKYKSNGFTSKCL